MTTQARISNAAIRKATGRTWSEWFAVLDAESAHSRPHKEVVALLRDTGGIKNDWWRQRIASEYEAVKGLRVVGQTATAGFEIGVQRAFPIPPEQAWVLITGAAGRAIWLGSVSQEPFTKGHVYRTAEGTKGEVRSLVPGTRLRLTWQPPDWPAPSTLQVHVAPRGENASVHIHQEKLPSEEERERMRRHWQQVLDRLMSIVEEESHSTE